MGSLDAQWFWYRFEYQARGSTHAHGCAYLHNDPGLCSLVKKAAEAWLAERKVQNQEEPAYITLREEGRIAKAKAIAYAGWLVTTLNDALPTNAWQLPQSHPSTCQTPSDSNDTDYHDLVNSVQRHSQCSPAYCLRHKPGQETPTCHFNFSRELCEVSDIHFEELSNATLSTKRNDPQLNSHQRFMLQNWRANVDLQIILLMWKHVPDTWLNMLQTSMPATAIFATCVGKLSHHHNPLTALRSSMLCVVGVCDFSAQETAHMLMGLPLYSCTYSFVCISLDGSCAIQTEATDQDDQTAQQAATNLSLFNCYANRAKYDSTFPGITLLNLCTFVARYTLYRGEIRQHSREAIVRTFPTYSSDPKSPTYGRYCKYQLIKYKPWHTVTSNLWNGNEDVDDIYIQAYHKFLHSENVHSYLPTVSEEINRAEHYLVDNETVTDDPETTSVERCQEEWMLLCQVNQRFRSDDHRESSVDWSAPTHSLPADIVCESPRWITTQKRSAQEQLSLPQKQLPSVNIQNLTADQQLAYSIVCNHQKSIIDGEVLDPL